MKPVEFFYALLPPDVWAKKPYRSRWVAPRETWELDYPGAVVIEPAAEVRMLAESEEEQAEMSRMMQASAIFRHET